MWPKVINNEFYQNFFEKCCEAHLIEFVKELFKSGNEIPVERITITEQHIKQIIEKAKGELHV